MKKSAPQEKGEAEIATRQREGTKIVPVLFPFSPGGSFSQGPTHYLRGATYIMATQESAESRVPDLSSTKAPDFWIGIPQHGDPWSSLMAPYS